MVLFWLPLNFRLSLFVFLLLLLSIVWDFGTNQWCSEVYFCLCTLELLLWHLGDKQGCWGWNPGQQHARQVTVLPLCPSVLYGRDTEFPRSQRCVGKSERSLHQGCWIGWWTGRLKGPFQPLRSVLWVAGRVWGLEKTFTLSFLPRQLSL